MEPLVKELLERHKKDRDLSKEKIEPGWDWSDADLEEYNLMNLNFSTYESPANFKNTNLKLSALTGSSFSYANLEGAELQGASLQEGRTRFEGANLKGVALAAANVNGAYFKYANLEFSDLAQANLIGTELSNAKLEGSNLWKTDLRGANLFEVDLRDTNLDETDFEFSNLYRSRLYGSNIELAILPKKDVHETERSEIESFEKKLRRQNIRDTIIEDIIEKINRINRDNNRFKKASNVYSAIRNTLHLNGLYLEESHYHYKERRAFTKHLKEKGQYGRYLLNWIFKITSGYGEKWHFALAWIIGVIIFFGTFYLFLGGPSGEVANPIIDSYYFSGVTFTTLGFGDLYPCSNNIIMRGAAMIEAIIGAFLMALFVVVISKKMMS